MENSAALLFGLNYQHTQFPLSGCINDVHRMTDWLRSKGVKDIRAYTDETTPHFTTKAGILQALRQLKKDSKTKKLKTVFIHYSGHGVQQRDRSGDERDRKDEALVPSDFEMNGMVKDDDISKILLNFHPKTKVFWLIDCCHSGTMADLMFKFNGRNKMRVERPVTKQKIPRILTLSGCRDTQTSSDAYDVMGHREYSGALTSCFLLSVRKDNSLCLNVFKLLKTVRDLLKQKQFAQVPLLCSSYDCSENKDTSIFF